jgi:transposase
MLQARGPQRTDSTHVLAAVRQLNRLELVGETMRRALNELAVAAPAWLRANVPPEWFPRYAQRFDNLRFPRERSERERLLETIGADGIQLLSAVYAADTPDRDQLRQLMGVEMLRRIWVQQFWTDNLADGSSRIRLRNDDNQPPGGLRIHSPFDEEARYSAKRTTTWVGYKTHLTVTCGDDEVHLITQVETTSAVVQDVSLAGTIYAALADKDLLPDVHFLDAGYVTADLLVEAKQALGVDVCGPVKQDVRWQANSGQGFGSAAFKIDWAAQTVICPNGQRSNAWSQQTNAYGKPVIQVKFKPSVCRACADQAQCTRSERGARNLVLQPQAQHEALQQVRQTQETDAFRKAYAKRSGIEGTISQAVRACAVRQARYRGVAKTHLQMIASAVAINLHRLFDWWRGVPRSLTRISPFASLAPEPALVAASWRT